MPVDEWFRTFFPRSAFRSIGKTSGPDVLIGGCGTGRHSILFARAYPGAKVLAVDLSLSSLSYAKEKTRAMGLDSIEYAQADILELGGLDRKFDVISSSGVLHHLADPEKGWRVLLSLLRPDGCMHVGLYSKLAWRDIIAAREWAAAQGYGSSADEIRRARQAIAAAAPHQPSFSNIVRRLDFYNTSECRDLLFHEQVHEFTIPQIAAFLDQNDLQFLGFSLGDVVGHFVRQFGIENETDLRAWHQFETANPSAFQGMYEFWIQKRRLPR
jgi:SAM-dependent methyltransferase